MALCHPFLFDSNHSYAARLLMNLTELFPILNFPSPIEKTILELLESDFSRISMLCKTAYTGDDFQFPIRNYTPSDRLLTLLDLLPCQYNDYIHLDIPEHIIIDTFQDVVHRASLYFQRHDSVGLSEDDVIWFRHIINKNIFKVGSLQFQPFEMIYLDEETLGEEYMHFSPKWKSQLPPGASVINCHIPAGTDLSNENVSASLSNAIALFQKLYPSTRFAAFLCYSWLLYPAMHTEFSPDSKILQFSNRFEIIGTCADTDQAMEYIIPNSTLAQKIKDHPEHFGFACGIISLT